MKHNSTDTSKTDMCDQLKDVPADEWDTLKADVRDLKETQQTMLEERASLKGWLKGWLAGIGLFFAFAQVIGGYIIYRAMNLPEETQQELTAFKADTNKALADMVKILEANNIADKNHHEDSSLHMEDVVKRQEFIPRTELTLTLSAMEQRSNQSRADIERQILEVKEQLLRLDAANVARAEKLDSKIDKLLDAKFKD